MKTHPIKGSFGVDFCAVSSCQFIRRNMGTTISSVTGSKRQPCNGLMFHLLPNVSLAWHSGQVVQVIWWRLLHPPTHPPEKVISPRVLCSPPQAAASLWAYENGREDCMASVLVQCSTSVLWHNRHIYILQYKTIAVSS